MISRDSTINCPPTGTYTDPCSATIPYGNNGSSRTTSNRPSSCYRPLQHLYKTVYSPINENNSSRNNFACICRPSERYKTTNMTYGSFHYDNWAFMQKSRPINYDRALFSQCYDNKNKQKKMNNQSTCDNLPNQISNRYGSEDSKYWTQTTSDACCPTDCCNNSTYTTSNCNTMI